MTQFLVKLFLTFVFFSVIAVFLYEDIPSKYRKVYDNFCNGLVAIDSTILIILVLSLIWS